MTTVTLKPKYEDILQIFGNFEDTVEKAVYEYSLKRINERIEKAQGEISALEAKYEMSYQAFYERVTTDEAFVDKLEQEHLMWEMDWQTWEYYTEVLTEWRGHLQKLSTL